jgi:hypothetical protein
MIIETRLININSADAIKNNGSFLSNVFFPFPNLISSKNVRKASISILNAQLPYSFYIINVYNNVLRMSVNGGSQFSLTLTRGNYNSNTLITEILAQLALIAITNITIALNTTTGSMSFTTTGTSIEFFATGSTILKVLGFDPTTNYVSVAKVLTAPFPLNLLNTLKIRIASYALTTSCLDSSVRGNLNVLAGFPVNAEGYGLNLYENTTGFKTELQVRDINGFDLQILDDDGNLINFNNVYWTLTMLIELEYIEEAISQNLMDFEVPTQEFWGADPAIAFAEQQKEEENDAEQKPPNFIATDTNSLEQLLIEKGIIQ